MPKPDMDTKAVREFRAWCRQQAASLPLQEVANPELLALLRKAAESPFTGLFDLWTGMRWEQQEAAAAARGEA